MKTLWAMFAALALLAVPVAVIAGEAQTPTARDAQPVLPCGAHARPAFPAVGAPPAIETWRAAELAKTGWKPPACTGMSSSARSKLVVALAATFRFEGDSHILLSRVGAMSSYRKMRYWSTSDKAWRPIANDAAALSTADPKTRRADFSPAELTKNVQLYYWMDDSRSGSVVYRLHVLEHAAHRIVVGSENLSPVQARFLTLFEPGTMQTAEFLERRGADRWEYYLLTRIDGRASVFASASEESYINRAVARYREIAGIPTEQEPPAAP